MHHEADAADHREQQEAQRDSIVGELRQHQAEKIQRDHGIELALAVLALAEGVGNFDGAQAPFALATRSSRILKPCAESFGASCSKRSRRTMKKPLMGSAISTRSIFLATSVASALAPARCLLKPSLL